MSEPFRRVADPGDGLSVGRDSGTPCVDLEREATAMLSRE